MTALLDVTGLRVAFGGKDVVKGIDFSIAAGEKLALVGESGSGKTVTALSLLGLAANAHCRGTARFALDTGSVDLLAMPEPDLRAIRGRDIAMIFQEPVASLNPCFTVGFQLEEQLKIHLGLGRHDRKVRAAELL
ncbi:MAG: ATP-binding cassette domain-containing protein, partial [Rhodoferax sp.]|nr:ATP-binding cassette domain-containing protein [Rhodoferax sp.]